MAVPAEPHFSATSMRLNRVANLEHDLVARLATRGINTAKVVFIVHKFLLTVRSPSALKFISLINCVFSFFPK